MQYIILEGDRPHLQAQVNIHLIEGYQLHGTPYSVNNTHYQAMIKGEAKSTRTIKNTSPKQHELL